LQMYFISLLLNKLAGFAMPKSTNMYQSALSNFATICHLW
jgi:hypothetical protein